MSPKPREPIVFMFPGQSSRSSKMFARAAEFAPDLTRSILQQASEILGRDVAAICNSERDDLFATNLDVQIGVFVANHIHARALESRGVHAELSLGLSLGEYNHLVQIGALGFEDALRLVNARGQAYDAGPDGAMVAIFPLSLDELEPLVQRANSQGDLAVSNANSPTQHVVGGARQDVDTLIGLVEEETFANAAIIEERIPMHTPRFRPVANILGPALDAAPWRPTTQPYIPNVSGEILLSPSSEDFMSHLRRHVYQPVLWQRSVEAVIAAHPKAVFVEAGPGRVLAGLMRRSWIEVDRYCTKDGQEFAETLEAVNGKAMSGGA